MFLPWTFLPLNVILAMFQFLLVSTVGSVLAIYSRFGGEYANSIRWVRQGGYLEMYNTLINSREYLSNRTKLILVVTILSSFAASVTDVGAVYFIHPSSRPSNQNSELVETTQFVSFDFQRSFSGWNTFIRNGDNVTNAMESMFNGTNRIPNFVNGRIYTPRTSEFQIGCDKINFSVEDDTNDINQGGCAKISFQTYFLFSDLHNKTTFKIMPNGRGSLKIPGIIPENGLSEPRSSIYFYYGNITCGLKDLDIAVTVSNINGLTSPPRTWTTRCALPTGELVAASLTSIKFSVKKVQDFRRVTSSMFNEDVELVHAMESSITKAGNETFYFNEFKYGNTTFDALVCMSAESGKSRLMAICSYNSVNAIITSPQDFNPVISAARKGAPFEGPPVDVVLGAMSGDNYTSTTVMAISHIPVVTNTTTQQLSIPGAKNASLASALYLASLGQNMYLDWNTSKLYVIYDIVDIESGFEMPLWLGIVVMVTMILCAAFCSLTQYFLNPVFTGSLYKVMSIQMAPKSSSFVAMIGWSNDHSIDCDGFRTTPGNSSFYDVDLMSEPWMTRAI